MMKITTHLQGMAAIYVVSSQLLLRGLTPYFPAFDSGIDLMLENGLKIQVKPARLRKSHPEYPHGIYNFDTRKTCKVRNKSLMWKIDRNYADFCDYYIFFGVDENRFFIVPCVEMGNSVNIPPRSYLPVGLTVKKFLEFEDAWHLLENRVREI